MRTPGSAVRRRCRGDLCGERLADRDEAEVAQELPGPRRHRVQVHVVGDLAHGVRAGGCGDGSGRTPMDARRRPAGRPPARGAGPAPASARKDRGGNRRRRSPGCSRRPAARRPEAAPSRAAPRTAPAGRRGDAALAAGPRSGCRSGGSTPGRCWSRSGSPSSRRMSSAQSASAVIEKNGARKPTTGSPTSVSRGRGSAGPPRGTWPESAGRRSDGYSRGTRSRAPAGRSRGRSPGCGRPASRPRRTSPAPRRRPSRSRRRPRPVSSRGAKRAHSSMSRSRPWYQSSTSTVKMWTGAVIASGSRGLRRQRDAPSRQEPLVEGVLLVEHLARGERAHRGAAGLGAPSRGGAAR